MYELFIITTIYLYLNRTQNNHQFMNIIYSNALIIITTRSQVGMYEMHQLLDSSYMWYQFGKQRYVKDLAHTSMVPFQTMNITDPPSES